MLRANYGKAKVHIHGDVQSLALAASSRAAILIRSAIAERGSARIMIATGNSQIEFVDALVHRSDLNWSLVDAFHMDEYMGLPASHPASFRNWVKHGFEMRAKPRSMHYLRGDAPDPDDELLRYAGYLNEDLIDVAFVGFGENGHIAFNDPPVARFDDPAVVKCVTLDEACRNQQVGEGHFADLESVPKEAMTVTCSGLLRAKSWICCVPERRKAEAVRGALEGPITTLCPASIVRQHPDATVYLDRESACLLTERSE